MGEIEKFCHETTISIVSASAPCRAGFLTRFSNLP
jgi:hypothetical protein